MLLVVSTPASAFTRLVGRADPDDVLRFPHPPTAAGERLLALVQTLGQRGLLLLVKLPIIGGWMVESGPVAWAASELSSVLYRLDERSERR